MNASRLGGLASGVLGLALLVSACTSSVLQVESGDVVGTWSWVRSTGGIAGMTRTPQTEGYEAELRFTPPIFTPGGPSDGTVEWRTDGELQWTTSWSLEVGDEGPFAGKSVIVYGEPVFGWDEQAVDFQRDGSLVLTDPCCDGFTHEFVRDAM